LLHACRGVKKSCGTGQSSVKKSCGTDLDGVKFTGSSKYSNFFLKVATILPRKSCGMESA
jgi:hypothetical protein